MIKEHEVIDLKLGYKFQIPRLSPHGQEVQIKRSERDGMTRIHVFTADRHEIYFEVVAYPEQVDHESMIQNQKEYILKQFDDAVVEENQQIEFKGLPATRFRFDSKNFARCFLFVDLAERTYRIVYDHHYPCNEQILEGLELGIG